MWEGGVQKVKTLQKTTGFSRKTLYRWLKQFEQTKDLKQGSHPGHPTRLTSSQHHHLGRIAKLHKLFSSSELTEKLKKTYSNLNIATQTVKETL